MVGWGGRERYQLFCEDVDDLKGRLTGYRSWSELWKDRDGRRYLLGGVLGAMAAVGGAVATARYGLSFLVPLVPASGTPVEEALAWGSAVALNVPFLATEVCTGFLSGVVATRTAGYARRR